jgi:hypothetical protein
LVICKVAHVGILKIKYDFGPSGVHVLPLAAGINVGGHYKWHFFPLSLLPGKLLILTEGVVVGFRNFAWAPK